MGRVRAQPLRQDPEVHLRWLAAWLAPHGTIDSTDNRPTQLTIAPLN
jgi:hypothetical protein